MSFFLLTFDLVMICSYSLAKDIIPNVALMIHIKAVVLQEAPGFGEVKTFPLKQQASENDDLTVIPDICHFFYTDKIFEE